MFGRQKKHTDGGEDSVQVDATLESDVTRVEQSVTEYLKDPTDASRGPLLTALQTLDEQTDQGDAFQESVIGSGAVGYASKGEVIGETSIDSVVDEIPSQELHAQIALVQAAKNEVRGPTSETFVALQSAHAALALTRDQGPEGQ
jgi:hypothetical protein